MISSIIVELVKNISHPKDWNGMARTKGRSFLTLLENRVSIRNAKIIRGETRTFTVNPKQRARHPFPFRKSVSVDKPFRASLMVGVACNVMGL
jgi:hypothetical protein